MLYVDSCDLGDIKAAFDTGLVGGVTTNPILANKAHVVYDEVFLRKVLAVSVGPVHVQPRMGQLTSYNIPERCVLKVPCTIEGLRLAGDLESEGVRANITAVMGVGQAILAAQSGASYVSIFWGRIEDAGGDPHDVVRVARKCLYKSGCRIIVGSVREPEQVSSALEAGAHIVTASWRVLQEMSQHAMTDKTLEDFDAAWVTQTAGGAH